MVTALIGVGSFVLGVICCLAVLRWAGETQPEPKPERTPLFRTTGERIGILLFVGAMLVASPAAAKESVSAWFATIETVHPEVVHTIRFGTSDTAYVERTSAPLAMLFRASDGPNVAALFNDMTNGVNNPFTWQTPSFSHTVAENAFFVWPPVETPIFGYSAWVHQPKVDLQGWTIDTISLRAAARSFFEPSGPYKYTVEVFATAPEPGGFALFVLGMVAMGHRIRRSK
jgi:hypothetical protein